MAAELLLDVLQLIKAVMDKYKDVHDLKDEVKQFRQILRSVRQVIVDVKAQLERDRPQHTSLRECVGILCRSVETADQVLEKCTRTEKRLKRFLFTKKYLEKLAASTSEMERGLSLLSAAGVVMQADILDGLEDVQEKVEQLTKMAARYQDELLDRLEQQSTQLEALPERLLELLVSQGVVDGREDYAHQLQEIKVEKDVLEKKKAEFDSHKATMDEQFLVYNMHLLHVAEQLSLNEGNVKVQSTPAQSNAPMLEALTCPISLEIMEDPVVLHPSGITYDKKSICVSLLNHPTLCPYTRMQYDSPLSYSDNVFARQQLMAIKGNAAYKRFDDTNFISQYKAKWQQQANQFHEQHTVVAAPERHEPPQPQTTESLSRPELTEVATSPESSEDQSQERESCKDQSQEQDFYKDQSQQHLATSPEFDQSQEQESYQDQLQEQESFQDQSHTEEAAWEPLNAREPWQRLRDQSQEQESNEDQSHEQGSRKDQSHEKHPYEHPSKEQHLKQDSSLRPQLLATLQAIAPDSQVRQQRQQRQWQQRQQHQQQEVNHSPPQPLASGVRSDWITPMEDFDCGLCFAYSIFGSYQIFCCGLPERVARDFNAIASHVGSTDRLSSKEVRGYYLLLMVPYCAFCGFWLNMKKRVKNLETMYADMHNLNHPEHNCLQLVFVPESVLRRIHKEHQRRFNTPMERE